jgi:hypothetical protein
MCSLYYKKLHNVKSDTPALPFPARTRALGTCAHKLTHMHNLHDFRREGGVRELKVERSVGGAGAGVDLGLGKGRRGGGRRGGAGGGGGEDVDLDGDGSGD